MLIALLIPLGLASLLFTVVLFRAALAKRTRPTAEGLLLGAVTNFFDTLGIGSFATTTASTTATAAISYRTQRRTSVAARSAAPARRRGGVARSASASARVRCSAA